MKAFLQEYGFSILAAIVVILLIMMVSPVGVSIKESLKSVVTNFSATAENGIDNANVFGEALQEENRIFTYLTRQKDLLPVSQKLMVTTRLCF